MGSMSHSRNSQKLNGLVRTEILVVLVMLYSLSYARGGGEEQEKIDRLVDIVLNKGADVKEEQFKDTGVNYKTYGDVSKHLKKILENEELWKLYREDMTSSITKAAETVPDSWKSLSTADSRMDGHKLLVAMKRHVPQPSQGDSHFRSSGGGKLAVPKTKVLTDHTCDEIVKHAGAILEMLKVEEKLGEYVWFGVQTGACIVSPLVIAKDGGKNTDFVKSEVMPLFAAVNLNI